ncbi:hypothetical protein L6R50_25965 [Myxococcota bacterium]|nr:hypothetical protein [Myxococcota bacterium]
MPPRRSPTPRALPLPEDPSLDAFLASVRLDGGPVRETAPPAAGGVGDGDLAALLLSLDLPGDAANAGPERGADGEEGVGRIGDGWEIEALAG